MSGIQHLTWLHKIRGGNTEIHIYMYVSLYYLGSIFSKNIVHPQDLKEC